MTDSIDAQEVYRVPLYVRIKRWLLRLIFKSTFLILFNVRVSGRENIPPPQQGGYMIAYNHISLVEPPFLLAFWPVLPEAVSGDDVFYRPGQGLMVRLYGALPVNREGNDRVALGEMVAMLLGGRPLIFSPEGGQSHKQGLRRAKTGVAFLIDRAQVPIVPVGIIGGGDGILRRAFTGKRPSLELRIGKPFGLPPIQGKGHARRASRQHNADFVMKHIAALLPPDHHGVYAESLDETKDLN